MEPEKTPSELSTQIKENFIEPCVDKMDEMVKLGTDAEYVLKKFESGNIPDNDAIEISKIVKNINAAIKSSPKEGVSLEDFWQKFAEQEKILETKIANLPPLEKNKIVMPDVVGRKENYSKPRELARKFGSELRIKLIKALEPKLKKLHIELEDLINDTKSKLPKYEWGYSDIIFRSWGKTKEGNLQKANSTLEQASNLQREIQNIPKSWENNTGSEATDVNEIAQKVKKLKKGTENTEEENKKFKPEF